LKLSIHKINNIPIAALEAADHAIAGVQDTLDLLADADYQGARRIMIKKEHLHPDFYDLKTGLAGEIIQKFENYYMKLAIVGDFSTKTSKNFKYLMFESNKSGQIFFVENTDEAIKYLTR
jgi:hypothetical protein